MKVVTNQQHYYDIAEVIREKTGITTPLKPAEMAPALADMVPADQLPHAEEFTFGANLALPEVPASVLAAYPKAVIFMVTSQESTQFVYIATTSAFYRVAGELLGMEYDLVVGSLGEGVKASDSGAGTWGDQFPVTAGTAGLMIGTEGSSTYSLVWANHDIYEVLAVDTATGNITTGAVYFAASADVVTGTAEEYRIQKESLDGIGEQVNRLCNTVEPMPPERMEEKLSDLDITLQDIVITPSDEEQIIKPEGHYGFYKITVEAVENSGTGGGGTPGGGEGDDTGDDTPTVPDITGGSFGNVAANEGEEVYTGKMLFNGTALPPLPADVLKDYPYAVIEKNGTSYTLYMTKEACTTTSSGYLTHGAPMGKRCSYNSNMTTWDGPSTQYSNNIKVSRIIWANYVVYNADNTVARLNSTPTYEKNADIQLKYADAEESYTISGDDANRLGAIAQALTGSNDTMSWDEIMETLETHMG